MQNTSKLSWILHQTWEVCCRWLSQKTFKVDGCLKSFKVMNEFWEHSTFFPLHLSFKNFFFLQPPGKRSLSSSKALYVASLSTFCPSQLLALLADKVFLPTFWGTDSQWKKVFIHQHFSKTSGNPWRGFSWSKEAEDSEQHNELLEETLESEFRRVL